MSISYALFVSWILYVSSACIIPGRRRATAKWHKPCCVSGALLSEKVLCPDTHLRQLPGKLMKALDSVNKLMNKTQLRVNNTDEVSRLRNLMVSNLNTTVEAPMQNMSKMQMAMKCDFKNMAILAMNWEEMKTDENKIDDNLMEYDKMNFNNATQELYSAMCSLSWLLKSLGYRVGYDVTTAQLNRTINSKFDKYCYNFILLKDTKKMLENWYKKYHKYKKGNTGLFVM